MAASGAPADSTEAQGPTDMQLSDLLGLAGVAPRALTGQAEITSLTDDSRQVVPGACFLAVRGAEADGHAYIPQAAEAGAAAIICEDPAAVPADLACAVVDQMRHAVGPLGQAFHGWPARKLITVGVTGTNGKTTMTWVLKQMLEHAGLSPALLGTVVYQTGGQDRAAATTTPGPLALAAMMAEMIAAGRTHLVMEVSSHALDQDRIGGVDLQVGVMTNVTGDHLDYHGTQEAYLAAKLKLFERLLPSATAVINRDDATGDRFAEASNGQVIWYGLSGAADVSARIDAIDIHGARFSLAVGDESAEAVTPLIGRHNIYNCLAAIAAARALEVPLGQIVSALANVRNVPGRLQRVESGKPFDVFVDYAHTDDALANVLSALRPVTQGRLVVLFGCGGDRDRTKRPRMAKVAQDLADHVFVTSDNPRTEDPDAIISEIVAGFDRDGLARSVILPDRREAIAAAIGYALPDDVVLIAGKGHETYQIIGTQRLAFDDAAVAADVLSESG